MERVVGVEGERVRASLWARPEWLSFRSRVILWEERSQITDVVVELGVEDILGDLDAIDELSYLSDLNQVLDLLQLVLHT